VCKTAGDTDKSGHLVVAKDRFRSVKKPHKRAYLQSTLKVAFWYINAGFIFAVLRELVLLLMFLGIATYSLELIR